MAAEFDRPQRSGGNDHRQTSRAALSQHLDGLLNMFPKDAALHRSLADWLARSGKSAAAIETYEAAARLFLNQGNVLPAVAAKLMQWGRVKPTHEDIQALYSRVRSCQTGKYPLADFFIRLAYPEMVAVLSVMELIEAPIGRAVRKFGTVENHLYLVVSGAFSSTRFMPPNGREDPLSGNPVILRENDVFGTIFPLDRQTVSPAFVKALSSSEAIRISKQRLVDACRAYPSVTAALEKLCTGKAQTAGSSEARTQSADNRRSMTLRLTVAFASQADENPMTVLEGHSNNISVGGACVVLAATGNEKLPPALTGQDVRIRVSLPGDSVAIDILGRTAWVHPAIVEGKVCIVLGIQFKQMTPQMIGYLMILSEILKKMN
jgi:CRP-like cAMP-binding protein